jgi:hypothetical protein
LGGSIHTIKKNAEALVFACKEIGQEVNADKCKCMVMSRDQNAGQIHTKNTDNNSLEGVKEFICLGTTLAYKYSVKEEIKNRLKSGNVCYHSVQEVLSSSLLSRNTPIMIKIYRTIILPVVL